MRQAGLGGAPLAGVTRRHPRHRLSPLGNLGHGFLTSTVDWEQRGALGHRPGTSSWGWEERGFGGP